MAQIGRKVYYELATGNVIVSTSEMSGSVRDTTTEEDFELYVDLQNKNPEAVGCIQLSFGEKVDEFRLCSGYNVDLGTGEIVFDMTPKSAEELEELKTTAEKLHELQAYKADAELRLADVELALAELFAGGGA
jgi:hypothetical protein